MTGAPIPPGADAVVMIEHTVSDGGAGRVVVQRSAVPGLFVRSAGEDVRAGEVVFAPGEVLGPAHLGIAAGLGRSRLVVQPRPHVGVLSTGDELAADPGPLRAGAIRDSNSVSLAGVARRRQVACRCSSGRSATTPRLSPRRSKRRRAPATR